jgi:hypothetical protein
MECEADEIAHSEISVELIAKFVEIPCSPKSKKKTFAASKRIDKSFRFKIGPQSSLVWRKRLYPNAKGSEIFGYSE